MPSTEATPEDTNAISEARALVRAAVPTTEAEWLVLHDEVHRIANRAPHPWLVLAHVAEDLVDRRPAGRESGEYSVQSSEVAAGGHASILH